MNELRIASMQMPIWISLSCTMVIKTAQGFLHADAKARPSSLCCEKDISLVPTDDFVFSLI